MVKKKILFCIQARIFSNRLPGKNFFNFFDETVLDRVIRIALKCVDKKNVFILSGNKKNNYLLSNVAKNHKLEIFYGNEKNVFKRFKSFLKKNKCDFVFRMTADNYLIQPKIVKKMLKNLNLKDFDYVYVEPLSHYAGELIKYKLFFGNKKISKLSQEHVTWDFRFDKKIRKFKYSDNFMGINHKKSITLDNIKDLIIMKNLEQNYLKLKNIDCINEIKKIQKNK